MRITPAYAGKAVGTFAGLTGRGITPACAGKSKYEIRTLQILREHPRVCGEK